MHFDNVISIHSKMLLIGMCSSCPKGKFVKQNFIINHLHAKSAKRFLTMYQKSFESNSLWKMCNDPDRMIWSQLWLIWEYIFIMYSGVF